MVKKLYRSRDEKMIAGVCGGLAEYFEIDPTIVRLLFLALLIFGGGGLLIYIIMWIIVPQKPFFLSNSNPYYTETVETEEIKNVNETNYNAETETTKTNNKNSIIGIIIIIVGILLLFDNFNLFFGFSKLWPLLLIIFGAYLIIKSKK
jgi:phage shock protein C